MNGMNEWMMQANEQQCLNELLTQPEVKLELLFQQLTAGRCPHPQAACRYLAPELHGFVQQLAVTSEEGLGHLAVCMEQ